MRVFTAPCFETAFDRPVSSLPPPGVLLSGAVPELSLVDNVARGTGIVGRFTAGAALVGVKVRPAGGPVRVTVALSLDRMSLDWWAERVPAELEPRDPGTPRLILVRSQGRTRGAVLLVRQPSDAGSSTAGLVTFDLAPDELTEQGLFVLEVLSVDRDRPDWAGAAPRGTVGVRIDRIEFAAAEGPRTAGAICTGRLPAGDQPAALRGGYFVVNPSDVRPGWLARPTLVPAPPAPPPPPRPAPPPRPKPAPRGLRRTVRRAARWVVPVAAVPVARRARKRIAGLKHRPAEKPAPPPPPKPVESTNPLDKLRADQVRVELVGLTGAAAPGVRAELRPGPAVEIVADGPLDGPALVRLELDPAVLAELPGATVRWDVQSSS